MASGRPGDGGSAVYSFSSQPKPVTGQRKKYREPGEADTTMYRDLKETSISWDKRVHRGNTYGMYTQQAINEAFQTAMSPQAKEKRKRRKVPEPSPFEMPLPENPKIAVDLSAHLIAKEVVVVLATIEAQTDEFLPEVPPDQYQPQKTGIDSSTQVEDGEIFIFDREVEPILDVLVNKTLEQSMMEVEEEFEMEQMAEFRVEFFSRQEKMMKDWQAQVNQESVRWEKKEMVVKRKREEKRREAVVLLKIQAIAAAKKEISRLVPNAVADLAPVAFPCMKAMAIDRLFLPQLFSNVQKEVKSKIDAQKQIDGVVANQIRDRFAREQISIVEKTALAAKYARAYHAEKEIRHGKIRISVDDGKGGSLPVGPIQISSRDAVDQVQDRVYAWIQENMKKLADKMPWGVLLLVNGVPLEAIEQIFTSMPGQISMAPKPKPPPPPASDRGEGEDGAGAEVDGD